MLLYKVEKYLKATRTPPTRFGREVVGDSRFVFDLRDGREPREKMVRRVEAYLRSHQEHVQ